MEPEKTEDKNYRMFFVLPEVVASDPNLSSGAKILYAHILSLSKGTGECYASNKYFAKYYHKSIRSIIYYIQELVKAKLIESRITYKEDSKEVDRRYLKTFLQVGANMTSPPDDRTCKGGTETDCLDNKTSNNNILSGLKTSTSLLPQQVIEYLNEKCNSRYKHTTPKTKTLILNLQKQGYKLADFQTVIDNKFLDWFHDRNMRIYLRPITLFSNKFESYLNQIPKDVAPGKSVEIVEFNIIPDELLLS